MSDTPKAFFILKVWPEPGSSAAGSHMLHLIRMVSTSFEVHLGSTAGFTEHTSSELSEMACLHKLRLNDSSFNKLMSELMPEVVIFDRYMTEEQFSWRVAEACPDALRVLDTEDLHFLRYAREMSVKNETDLDLHHDRTYRELASIWRSDLSLIVSKAEMELLIQTCGIPASLLHYLPLLVEEPLIKSAVGFNSRKDLVMIGNGHHPPNTDSVLYFHNELWPQISKVIGNAEVHIYGAYLPQVILQLHEPGGRFKIMGRADDALQTLEKYRILIAPLRFGAGLKGKLIDAMQSGTPSITSVIGVEGFAPADEWPGYCYRKKTDLNDATSRLYSEKKVWTNAVSNIKPILSRHRMEEHIQPFLEELQKRLTHLQEYRASGFVPGILWHQSMRSTEYMSRWIEEKNKRE